MYIFRGNIQTLKELVGLTGIAGEWHELGGGYQYTTTEKVSLNFWPGSKKMYFQHGKKNEQDKIKFENLLLKEIEKRHNAGSGNALADIAAGTSEGNDISLPDIINKIEETDNQITELEAKITSLKAEKAKLQKYLKDRGLECH